MSNHESQSKVMDNILGFAKDVVSTSLSITKDVADKMVDYANDLTGSRSHNIIHCGSKDSVIRSPNIPICVTFPGKSCTAGTLISICGTPSTNFARKFGVNLMTDCEHFNNLQASIALHFNPRFNENHRVIMNSQLGNEWGEEERSDYFPFVQGVPFKMMILIEEEEFKIAVNGRHCYSFKHRTDYSKIRRLHIYGNISIDLIEFRKELSYLKDPSKELASISGDSKTCEELKAMLDDPTDVKTVIVPCPTIPYSDQDARYGKPFNIYIAGLMPNYFREYFVINFAKSQDNPTNERTIPFHLSIRPDVLTIIRNSKDNGIWQQEERFFDGSFPFVLGTNFDLMICNRLDKISVIVNGQFLCDFKHRMDPSLIDLVEITGSALITSLRIEYF